MRIKYSKLPKNIACPLCGLKHYFVRQETKKFICDRLIYIKCDCGVLYKVKPTMTGNSVISVERSIYANK